MPHSSLRPSQRLAPRCGQYWSMTPTTPRLSRKASNSSPITTIFFGAPSARAIPRRATPAARTAAAVRPWRSRAAFGEEPVVFCAEHGGSSGKSALAQAWRRTGEASTQLVLAARYGARVVHWSVRARKQRAWGMPGARCTRSLAWKSKKAHELVTTVAPDHPAFPHANGFNGFLRALPGDRAFLSPSPARSCFSPT